MAIQISLFFSSLILLLLLVVAAATNNAGSYRIRSNEELGPESDRVYGLPSQPPVKFRHYAGYVKVGKEKQKALFYWFFEAEERSKEKPLLLWLNGGPGCSSVGYGAVQELGPFLVAGHVQNLTLNSNSWNKVANLLFLESPIGVGFSYTNRSSDLEELGDGVTANDSYEFLLSWLEKFPSFKSHDFYMAGESYAGHYVPQLAELIYEGNKVAKNGSSIRFKGFMIGNAVINDETDEMGMVEYAWSHAIISDELHAAILKDCNSFKKDNNNSACSPTLKAFMEAYSEIDIYSIYSSLCPSVFNESRSKPQRPKLVTAPHLFSQQEIWSVPAGYDPCSEDYAENYFNREDVQRALHANITHLSYPYSLCSVVIRKWNDSADTVLPIIQKLLDAGLRIWVYSGDTDGRVPVTSTRLSINKLGLKPLEKSKKGNGGWGGWRAWFHKKEVAGWVVEYEKGLTLATVRGAGHQVPAFAPEQSLSLVSHFLNAESLPSTRF